MTPAPPWTPERLAELKHNLRVVLGPTLFSEADDALAEIERLTAQVREAEADIASLKDEILRLDARWDALRPLLGRSPTRIGEPAMSERTFTAADSPGFNSEVERLIVSYAVQACIAFTPSQHGNAHRRTSGADAICITCHKPQSQHWLRQVFSALTASSEREAALREAIRVEREEMGRGNTMADTTWLAALRWVTDRMDALGLSPMEPAPPQEAK